MTRTQWTRILWADHVMFRLGVVLAFLLSSGAVALAEDAAPPKSASAARQSRPTPKLSWPPSR